MRFQQQLTQIAGTVQVAGTTSIAGTVNVQAQQRLVGTFTPTGASGSFTITGLQPSDQFLWFVFDPAQAGADPVWLQGTGVTNVNQTYGSIVVTTQTPDFIPCLPLVENQIRVAYTTLISGTNPIGLKVYASPVAPTRIPKLVIAQQFQGAMTAAQVVSLLGATSIARLKQVTMSLTVSAGVGASQVHLDYRTIDNALHNIYADLGIAPAGSSSSFSLSVNLHDTLASGTTGNNAVQFVADNGMTLASVNLEYEDLRGK